MKSAHPVLTTVFVLVAAALASAAGPDRRLVDAARDRDAAAVAALLKQKADVNAPDPDGATALHWAAHWNEVETADRLLRAGANVNAANEYGATPLWLASVNGSTAMIDRLLMGGANPNAAIKSGETPLMTATRSGNLAAVETLIVAGADVRARETVRGQNALMWATAERHLDVMRALLAAGAEANSTSTGGSTPLIFAAREGVLEAARLLVERGANVNAAAADGSTPLLVAVVRGHVPMAEYLLERGADPNADGAGYTALHWAAGIWETSTTFDYRFTSGEWAALGGIPARQEKLRIIKALLARGANVNAVTRKSPPRFGFTLFAGGEISLVNATPFFVAAHVGDSEVMRLLAAAGADPTIAAKDNQTPLIVAAGRTRTDNETRVPEANALEAVKVALELGNDINAANAAGETPLHAAALAGLNSVVQYLVDHGASLTAKTKNGKTPLEFASGTIVSMQVVVRPSTVALLKKLGGQAQ